MIDKLLIIVGILVLCCTSAGADDHRNDTYRWEDAEGNVFYSDLPPPTGARNVTHSMVESDAPTPDLPYELQMAVSKYPVTIYLAEDCGAPCDGASALLIGRGVPHTVLDAMTPDVNKKLNELTKGEPAVPVAEIGDIVIQGFEQGRWNSALDSAGYPHDAMITVTPHIPAAKASEDDIDDEDDSDFDDSDDFEYDEFDEEEGEFDDEEDF